MKFVTNLRTSDNFNSNLKTPSFIVCFTLVKMKVTKDQLCLLFQPKVVIFSSSTFKFKGKKMFQLIKIQTDYHISSLKKEKKNRQTND